MLGTFSSSAGIMSHSTHWSILWFDHPYPHDLNQAASQSHSKLNTALLEFIPISNKYSYIGTSNAVLTAIGPYRSQASWMFTIIPFFVCPPKNLNGGIFPTGIDFSSPIMYFMNNTTGI